MKHILLPAMFAALLLPASAEISPYRAALKSAHDRYHVLDAERNDYRKSSPGLPADREAEYQRVLGQLLIDDPVWALTQQLQADIGALASVRSRTPADNETLENLKDLLALTSGIEERVTTRQEGEKYATALRQFIARRDVAGAKAWAKAQGN